MKLVSFEVAKALKDAGYPQGLEAAYYNENGILVKPYVFNGGQEIADAPTYMDVWLWLWREKGTPIQVDYAFWGVNARINDPEEAIILGIDYLVEHNLIK